MTRPGVNYTSNDCFLFCFYSRTIQTIKHDLGLFFAKALLADQQTSPQRVLIIFVSIFLQQPKETIQRKENNLDRFNQSGAESTDRPTDKPSYRHERMLKSTFL